MVIHETYIFVKNRDRKAVGKMVILKTYIFVKDLDG